MIKRFLFLLYRFLPIGTRRLLVQLAGEKFTVGVLAIVLKNRRILLLRHSYHHYSWGLPGGLLKRGENPNEAIVREIEEEIGIKVRVEKLLKITNYQEWPRLEILFLCQIVNGKIKVDRNEVEEARFFELNSLPEQIVNTHHEHLSFFKDNLKGKT